MATFGSEERGKSGRGGATAADGGPRASTLETRQAILRAARERFTHYGFKKTTIDEIAADAGIGKGTVYLYFEGKEEILLTLVLEVKRNITEQMRTIAASLASPEDKLRRMVSAWILSVYDAYTATAHSNELVDDLRPHLMKRPQYVDQFRRENEASHHLLAETFREGDSGGVLEVPDAEKSAHLFMAAFAAFFPPYICPLYPTVRSRMEIEEGAQEMVEFLLRGLRRRA